MVAALAGCDDEPTAPRVLPLCGAPVSVTVSAGLAPTFDWSPACRVSMLQVSEADTEFPVWTVFAAPWTSPALRPL